MQNNIERCKALLGTFVDVSLSGDVTDKELIELSNNVFDEIERIQKLMSFHEPLSELSQLNKKMLYQVNHEFLVSDDLLNVLKLAMQLFEQSKGHYDITVATKLVLDGELPDHLKVEELSMKEAYLGNSQNVFVHKNYIINSLPVCFDLGGIAKGYAVDCAIKKIPEHIEFIINAGGDMAVSNWTNHQVALKFGINQQALKVVRMLESSVASSANYYHGSRSHVINPLKIDTSNQGTAHRFSGSVSVFARNTMLADALTKIVILMKPKMAKPILEYFNAKAIVINRFGFKRMLNV